MFVIMQEKWILAMGINVQPILISARIRSIGNIETGRVRQRGVNSVVASGLHFQAAFGVICSG